MSVINIKCVDQTLTITNAPVIASGDIGADTVVFDFCSAWTGYTKTAVFWRSEDDAYHVVLDANDSGLIPHEVLTTEGTLYFGVYGVNDNEIQRTSEVLRYTIVKGVITENTEPPDPSADIYTQLLAKYAETTTSLGSKADKVSSATANNFAGLDANGNLKDSGKKASDFQPETNGLTAETEIVDGDYFPFYDTSATAHRKTLWSNIKEVLKTYFDTVYVSGGNFVPTTRKVNNKALSEDITITLSDLGAQAQHTTQTVTLAVANWSSSAQTVSVTGVTATNTVFVAPNSDSQTAYGEAGVKCTAQGAGTLTFGCTDTPTDALTVNVVILGVAS